MEPAHRAFVIGLMLLAGASSFCSPKPAEAPPATATKAPDPTRPPQTRLASPSVAVGEDLARICKLTMDSARDAQRAPKFDFDKSDLSPTDRDVLAQVARCLTTGPLRGRAIKLIGRADARGESEYNMGLGGHRAESVRSFLAQLGVDQQKIIQTSRGELDATGQDEEGWRRDRRVDVLLQ